MTLRRNVLLLLLGDDLGLSDGNNRTAGWRPYEPPGTGGGRPVTLPGIDVDQSQGIIALLGSNRNQEAGAGYRFIWWVSDSPAVQHLVPVYVRLRR